MKDGFSYKESNLVWGEPLTQRGFLARRIHIIMNELWLIVGGLWLGWSWLACLLFWVEAWWWVGCAGLCFLVYRVWQKPAISLWQIPNKKELDIAKFFTPNAHKAIEQAYRLSLKYKRTNFDSLSLLIALLEDKSLATVFWRLGTSPKIILAKLQPLLATAQSSTSDSTAEIYQLFLVAFNLAKKARAEFVGTAELFLAAEAQNPAVAEMLYDLSIDKDTLLKAVEWMQINERLRAEYKRFHHLGQRRNRHGLDRAMTAVATPYLNSFSQDLTAAAARGYLPLCVARDSEIAEIFRLVESGRSLVLLIGEAGVGKTSIINGVAERMMTEEIPARLRDKRLMNVSATALLAGTTVAGAEDRLLKLLNETERAGNIILFFDHIQDLLSGNSGAGLDVAGALAERLSAGQTLVVATITPEAYAKFFSQSALSSLAGTINVAEMDFARTVSVLEARAGGIEFKHKVLILYAAVAKAAQFAARFMPDERLPASAVSLLSEAASLVQAEGKNKLVTAESVAAVVAQKTGIPLTAISEDESDKLLRLETALHERVVGQDEAVSLVANALRRARANIRSNKKPMASFLFLGPTGVGKTELAKTIAEVYFGSEARMIRLDMSEFQNAAAVYRLIGEPNSPGTGLLTEAVRHQPFSLILLDELEKADKNVLNVFLSVFDDGFLTDSTGRKIDFTNTILIATSNAGTAFVTEQMKKGIDQVTIRTALIHTELKNYYQPEFLNRFDGIVLFSSLTSDNIRAVAKRLLKRVEADLEKRGVRLRVEELALDKLAAVGFDPEFGARPMRRAIQDTIENGLAELILSKKLKRRDSVVVGPDLSLSVERE